MKISEKCFKRCNFMICLFPIIYYIISDTFHVNKYIKFSMVILACIYTMLLGIGHTCTNKLINKKKDAVELILRNLFIIVLVVYWYFKFVY